MTSRALVACLLLASLIAGSAHAGPCPGGGSLDITAAADSLTLSPAAATTFNFGEHVILTATVSGFTIATYAWTIDGPTIKDYNEDLGTKASPPATAALPWSTTTLSPTDLTASSVGFYWAPTAAQTEPNNGPFTRNVSLSVTTSSGGSCTVTVPFTVERNTSDTNRQAEDFYTSNHRASTTTNPLFGHVVDEHIFWHMSIDRSTTVPQWMRFLAWHGEFVRRFDLWRQEFGYNKVAPWYPGRPLPTGPQFDVDPALRASFVADDNRIPTYYTIAGGTVADSGGQVKLADYATLDHFSDSFEFSFHGHVHCDIGASGGSFFGTSGVGYGSMCNASSPKDPMFWRWHGFIDVMYRNYCALRPGACASPSPADPPAAPWMADNGTDISNGGTVPSPAPHWISPDVWNRRSAVTTDACVDPVDSYGNHVTAGGVVRDCGTSADHENPVAGVTNYLYGTLRNTRPDPGRTVYAEVAVYIASASTGLAWPTDFTQLPESRQFITLHLEPGQTSSIGPIPWTPPNPSPSDHFCLYLRVLSVQETPPVEGADIDVNTANSNSIAWRNVKVVSPGDTSPPTFIIRNIRDGTGRLTLGVELPEALLAAGGRVRILPDEALVRAMKVGEAKLDGLTREADGSLTMVRPKAVIDGLSLAHRQQGVVKVVIVGAKKAVEGDVIVTQSSPEGIDGGVTLRLSPRKRYGRSKR